MMVMLCRSASLAEVYGSWLQHEFQTRPTLKQIATANFPDVIPLIHNPNYGNETENIKRAALMHVWRGWVQNIPRETSWNIASFDEYDVDKTTLIDSVDWRNLTGRSLKPLDAANRIDEDKSIRTGTLSAQVNYILNNYVSMSTQNFRPVILGPIEGPFTVIDGVHRIVAYCLYHLVRKEEVFTPKEVYLGITPQPIQFSFPS